MARRLTAALTAATTLVSATAATRAVAACDNAGVIIRIEGRPEDVVITRTTRNANVVVTRPRVLEPVCYDDVVRTTGATVVVLSIDGSGMVRVDHNVNYTVPRGHGSPSLAGNAYRTLSDQVMPDMKRLPWNVRIKGGDDEFGFAVPGLSGGGQQLRAGARDVLIRLIGGDPPFKVEIRNKHGALMASAVASSHEVLLPHVMLAPGAYEITASDATPLTLEAPVAVVEAAPPPTDNASDISDPEVRSAVKATELARSAPATWSFEAEQQLQAAPVDGLDRDKVFELIESYSAD